MSDEMTDETTTDQAPATTTPLTTDQKLAMPFALDEHASVQKGGSWQTYAPWTEYAQRMDDVLGVNGWSNRVLREGFTDTECWVLVQVSAWIDGREVVREQYGCEPIVKGTKPTGDLLKSVATDALKKAISLFGPGRYLSVKEEREKVDQAIREAALALAEQMAPTSPGARPDAAPTHRDAYQGEPALLRPRGTAPAAPAPLAPGDRAGWEQKYEALRERALALHFTASWSGKGPEAWNDVQLPKMTGLLEQYITRQRGAA